MKLPTSQFDDSKEITEGNNDKDDSRKEDLKSFIDANINENINHARHVETEIHTFTGIYMAVVAGVLAFNFAGRDGNTFQLWLHLIILLGGLLAMFLLNRWYTAFDTFMAYAECLSTIKEKMVLSDLSVVEAQNAWKRFTLKYEEGVLDYKVKNPKKEAMVSAFGEDYDSHGRFFAFSIPRAKGGIRTRNFIFGFHGVILIAVALIVIVDLHSLIVL